MSDRTGIPAAGVPDMPVLFFYNTGKLMYKIKVINRNDLIIRGI